MKTTTKLWIAIVILALLSPLGLILPEVFKAGDAWGEWGLFPGIWNAPMPDYAFKGREQGGLAGLSLGYIVSAVIGIVVTAAIMLVLAGILRRKE